MLRLQPLSLVALVGLSFALGGCIAGAGDEDDVAETSQALVTGTATAQSWSSTTHTLGAIEVTGAPIQLRHLGTTVHVVIDNPDFIPSESCRSIAYTWNTGVAQGQGTLWFENLLGNMARSSCKVAFDRADSPHTDGSFDLARIAPTP
jgi:hypothetical protein